MSQLYSNNFCGKNEQNQSERTQLKNIQNQNSFKFMQNYQANSHQREIPITFQELCYQKSKNNQRIDQPNSFQNQFYDHNENVQGLMQYGRQLIPLNEERYDFVDQSEASQKSFEELNQSHRSAFRPYQRSNIQLSNQCHQQLLPVENQKVFRQIYEQKIIPQMSNHLNDQNPKHIENQLKNEILFSKLQNVNSRGKTLQSQIHMPLQYENMRRLPSQKVILTNKFDRYQNHQIQPFQDITLYQTNRRPNGINFGFQVQPDKFIRNLNYLNQNQFEESKIQQNLQQYQQRPNHYGVQLNNHDIHFQNEAAQQKIQMYAPNYQNQYYQKRPFQYQPLNFDSILRNQQQAQENQFFSKNPENYLMRRQMMKYQIPNDQQYYNEQEENELQNYQGTKQQQNIKKASFQFSFNKNINHDDSIFVDQSTCIPVSADDDTYNYLIQNSFKHQENLKRSSQSNQFECQSNRNSQNQALASSQIKKQHSNFIHTHKVINKNSLGELSVVSEDSREGVQESKNQYQHPNVYKIEDSYISPKQFFNLQKNKVIISLKKNSTYAQKLQESPRKFHESQTETSQSSIIENQNDGPQNLKKLENTQKKNIQIFDRKVSIPAQNSNKQVEEQKENPIQSSKINDTKNFNEQENNQQKIVLKQEEKKVQASQNENIATKSSQQEKNQSETKSSTYLTCTQNDSFSHLQQINPSTIPSDFEKCLIQINQNSLNIRNLQHKNQTFSSIQLNKLIQQKEEMQKNQLNEQLKLDKKNQCEPTHLDELQDSKNLISLLPLKRRHQEFEANYGKENSLVILKDQSQELQQEKSKINPCKYLKLVHQKQKRAFEFPVFREQDVYKKDESAKDEIMQQFKDSTIETSKDDDVDTDDDVFQGGFDMCIQDLHVLNDFINKNKHFRVLTNIVQKWSQNGFWFGKDGRQHQCVFKFK